MSVILKTIFQYNEEHKRIINVSNSITTHILTFFSFFLGFFLLEVGDSNMHLLISFIVTIILSYCMGQFLQINVQIANGEYVFFISLMRFSESVSYIFKSMSVLLFITLLVVYLSYLITIFIRRNFKRISIRNYMYMIKKKRLPNVVVSHKLNLELKEKEAFYMQFNVFQYDSAYSFHIVEPFRKNLFMNFKNYSRSIDVFCSIFASAMVVLSNSKLPDIFEKNNRPLLNIYISYFLASIIATQLLVLYSKMTRIIFLDSCRNLHCINKVFDMILFISSGLYLKKI